MLLSFLAYNKRLCLTNKLNPASLRKKNKKSKGEETGERFKKFQYWPFLKRCLSFPVADTGYVRFEEEVKFSKKFEAAAPIWKIHKLPALGKFFFLVLEVTSAQPRATEPLIHFKIARFTTEKEGSS